MWRPQVRTAHTISIVRAAAAGRRCQVLARRAIWMTFAADDVSRSLLCRAAIRIEGTPRDGQGLIGPGPGERWRLAARFNR